jgi:hypothetical protein
MGNNDTYVLKINLNDVNCGNLQESIDKLIDDTNSYNEIVIMSKKEYNEYIFNNSGTFINGFDCDIDICTICHNQIKNYNKIFQLNMCNHQFHHKCIKKWFKTISDQYNLLHHCPTCRSSNESIVEL